jgi:hypothetical protein
MGRGIGSACAAGPGIASFECASFILGQTAPYSGVLTGLDGPFQAGLNHLAPTAYSLGFLDLEEGRPGVPNREEQLGVLVQAGSAVAPSHKIELLESEVRGISFMPTASDSALSSRWCSTGFNV